MAELLTRVTIWIALALFAGSAVVRRSQRGGGRAALALSFTGWTLFVGHVLLAFDTHYAWSHAVAYAETAEQTAALTGLDWGGGLYVNCLFGLVWLGELAWWGLDAPGYHGRPRSVELAVRGFFVFMVLNGAVIFVAGPQRWLGVALVTALAWAWRPGTPLDQRTSRS